jgi:hypothetical protein
MEDYLQQANDQKQLEWELDEAFKDLEEGNMLTVAQIDTLRHACGFPKKTRVIPLLQQNIDTFREIFGGKQ